MCIICGKSFSRSLTMRRHLQDIHNCSDKEYRCPPYNKYFKAKNNIYQHNRYHHRGLADKKGDYEKFAMKKVNKDLV